MAGKSADRKGQERWFKLTLNYSKVYYWRQEQLRGSNDLWTLHLSTSSFRVKRTAKWASKGNFCRCTVDCSTKQGCFSPNHITEKVYKNPCKCGYPLRKDGASWFLIIDLSIVNILLLYWISIGIADMFTLAWLTWQIVKSMQNISRLPSFLVKMQLKQIKREVPWN